MCLNLDSESSTLSRFECRASKSFLRQLASTESKLLQLAVPLMNRCVSSFFYKESTFLRTGVIS